MKNGVRWNIKLAYRSSLLLFGFCSLLFIPTPKALLIVFKQVTKTINLKVNINYHKFIKWKCIEIKITEIGFLCSVSFNSTGIYAMKSSYFFQNKKFKLLERNRWCYGEFKTNERPSLNFKELYGRVSE